MQANDTCTRAVLWRRLPGGASCHPPAYPPRSCVFNSRCTHALALSSGGDYPYLHPLTSTYMQLHAVTCCYMLLAPTCTQLHATTYYCYDRWAPPSTQRCMPSASISQEPTARGLADGTAPSSPAPSDSSFRQLLPTASTRDAGTLPASPLPQARADAIVQRGS